MNTFEHVIEHKVTDFLDRFHKENTAMTTPASTSAPAGTELPWWTALHQNLAVFASRIDVFLPKLEAIATNPMLDDGVEALLTAFAGPMADEVFTAVITLLKAEPDGHLSAAIDLLSVIAHKTPAAAGTATVQAAAQGLRQAVAASGGDVQAQLGAQPAAATGPQQTMQPRVIV